MHGGALGSGAPRGNKNALKLGFYTHEAIMERKRVRNLIRQSDKLIMQVTESAKQDSEDSKA
jgi:glucans biosynthesis protein